MKVTISVGGRFHAFYLAQQLYKSGYLGRLITSYPKSRVIKYGIPRNKVSTIMVKEMIERGWMYLPPSLARFYNPQYAISEIFDQVAKRHLKDGDILVAWSSFALHTIRKAKDRGMKTIVERGSSHMLYQQQILREEYEKFGLKPKLAHYKIVEKELKEYEEADYISIPSQFAKKTFLDKGFPENKLIHIPYGVNLSEFRRIPKDDDIFRIVYAGAMSLQKGVHYLLRSFAELNLPNSQLLLVGSLSDEIKPFFKKYEGKYKWIGHIPESELYKYYSQGSVFVMPSIDDGFGMVQLQAMACGLPVIGTTNCGAKDIVRDGIDGFIISIRDVEALKEKLTYLADNQDICNQMGQNAKERVSKGFTWDNYGEKIIQAYKKCIGI